MLELGTVPSPEPRDVAPASQDSHLKNSQQTLTIHHSIRNMSSYTSTSSTNSPPKYHTHPRNQCANTRYMFTGCGDVCLKRCSIHPVDPETFLNTCPDPRAGFSSVTVGGICPLCASKAPFEGPIKEHEQYLESLTQTQTAEREANRQGTLDLKPSAAAPRATLMAQQVFNLRQELFRAEIHTTQMELEKCKKMMRRKISCGGLDYIGRSMEWVPGKEDFGYVLWFTSEDDTSLWTWDC